MGSWSGRRLGGPRWRTVQRVSRTSGRVPRRTPSIAKPLRWAAQHPIAAALGAALVIGGAAVAWSGSDSPESAAREFVSATLSNDSLLVSELTCDAKLTEVQSAGGFLSAMMVLFGVPNEVRGSTSELAVQTLEQSGDGARVRVTGRVTAAIMGFAQTSRVDQTLLMRHERGRWRYCGAAASGAATAVRS